MNPPLFQFIPYPIIIIEKNYEPAFPTEEDLY